MTMTKKILGRLILLTAAIVASAPASSDQKQMKMTAEVPPGIAVPDELETRIGTLTFKDGFPTPETTQMIYDQLDFQRAIEAAFMVSPAASLAAFREANRIAGPDNTSGILWERMDSKVLLLTPNTTVIYLFTWLELSDGPVVVNLPAGSLGLVNDFWFRYVADLGQAGPDRGEGGAYLFLPPGYEDQVPDGYNVVQSPTFGNWFLLRHGDIDLVKQMTVYPLSKADAPPDYQFVDSEMQEINTVHTVDFKFWEEVNSIVQEEPSASQSPEILGLLASIGIKKGEPFEPDERMRGILEDAIKVAGAGFRVVLYDSRDPEAQVFPNSGWEHPWVGGSHEFMNDGARLINARTRFHFYATGITPAMVTPSVGKGSQYIAGIRDANDQPLDGSKTYKVNLPPDVPANDFWAFTLYDVQTRSMLQTDERFPEISSKMDSPVPNEDGSIDIFFGPESPEGKEANWVQTVPGKGWHMLFRLYGPEQAWFDGTWRPSEIEPVD